MRFHRTPRGIVDCRIIGCARKERARRPSGTAVVAAIVGIARPDSLPAENRRYPGPTRRIAGGVERSDTEERRYEPTVWKEREMAVKKEPIVWEESAADERRSSGKAGMSNEAADAHSANAATEAAGVHSAKAAAKTAGVHPTEAATAEAASVHPTEAATAEAASMHSAEAALRRSRDQGGTDDCGCRGAGEFPVNHGCPPRFGQQPPFFAVYTRLNEQKLTIHSR